MCSVAAFSGTLSPSADELSLSPLSAGLKYLQWKFIFRIKKKLINQADQRLVRSAVPFSRCLFIVPDKSRSCVEIFQVFDGQGIKELKVAPMMHSTLISEGLLTFAARSRKGSWQSWA